MNARCIIGAGTALCFLYRPSTYAGIPSTTTAKASPELATRYQPVNRDLIQTTSSYVIIFYPDKKKHSQLDRRGREKTHFVMWQEDGQKILETFYRNGLEYRKLTWYGTGQQQGEIIYHVGKPLRSTYWFPDGKMASMVEYSPHEVIHSMLYSRSGKQIRDQTTRQGHPTGTWTFWNSDGDMLSQTIYQDEHQYRTLYYKNGKKQEERHYKDGKKEGPDIFYKPDGSELGQFNYKDDVMLSSSTKK